MLDGEGIDALIIVGIVALIIVLDDSLKNVELFTNEETVEPELSIQFSVFHKFVQDFQGTFIDWYI